VYFIINQSGSVGLNFKPKEALSSLQPDVRNLNSSKGHRYLGCVVSFIFCEYGNVILTIHYKNIFVLLIIVSIVQDS
jgi:hypothetical protein